jgi:5-methylcytosine-specific restriction endonuclease McrA
VKNTGLFFFGAVMQTGRDSILSFLDAQRRAGVVSRTLQWSFPDQWNSSGQRVCVWCGKALPSGKKKKRWCSQKCVDEFLIIKGDMGLVRAKLRKRERECCQGCGGDLKALAQVLRIDLEALGSPNIRASTFMTIWGRWRDWFGKKQKGELDHHAAGFILGPSPPASVVHTRLLLQQFSRRSLWQADHIVAVEDGGSGTDLSNLQLLCTKCHLGKTNAKKALKALQRMEALQAPKIPGILQPPP